MNIFVKNLPLTVMEQDIRELFIPFGAVETVYVVKEKHTGTAQGEAYIIMPVDAEAEHAITKLNGVDFKGKQLRVVRAESSDFPSGDYW